jgi:hypothetical protein
MDQHAGRNAFQSDIVADLDRGRTGYDYAALA